MRLFQKFLWIGFALTLTGAALGAPPRADPDPVDAHGFIDPCTVNNHEEMYVECVLCDTTQPAPCSDRFGAKGYTKKCQTRAGHSGPTGEVWCFDQRPKPKPPEAANWLAILASVGAVAALAAGYYVWKRRSSR